ncbi:MAG: xanthine dehydrogenase family protein molybdopterin-binding subunit, partial [Promethearchaeota archaeon]
SVGLQQTLEKAVEISNWRKKWKPAPKNEELWKETKHFGIGMSTIFYGVGLGSAGKHMARTGSYVLVKSDGSANFAVGNTEMGQGAITVLSQIVADGLGIPYEMVRMLPVDTSRVPDSGPTVASRTTTFSGRALLNACKEINNRLQKVAADVLKCSLDRTTRQGKYWKDEESGRTVNVINIMEEAFKRRVNLAAAGWDVSPETEFDSEKGQGKCPYIVYAWATNVVEVEVDIDTGTIETKRVIAVHDVGKAINPETLEGQIQGGSVQGLGYGRFEEIIWDEHGKIQNPDLGRYIIPSSKDLPDIESYYIESEYPEGPFGAKGMGEQPLMGLAPAFSNAVYNAIGIRFTEIPLTPERVWSTIQELRGDK